VSPRFRVGQQTLASGLLDLRHVGQFERTLQQLSQVICTQGLQHIDRGTRQQSGVDLERRVFCGGANEREQATFDMRQKSILLAFVESVHFVHKDDGVLSLQA